MTTVLPPLLETLGERGPVDPQFPAPDTERIRNWTRNRPINDRVTAHLNTDQPLYRRWFRLQVRRHSMSCNVLRSGACVGIIIRNDDYEDEMRRFIVACGNNCKISSEK